jgi:DNA-binding NarL/FixJ family response regulator
MKPQEDEESRPIKILLIDDHHLVREGLKAMLQSPKAWHTYITDEATTGSALAKIETNAYDLILLDYQLPDMNGAQLTKAILKKKPDAKILALSTYEEETPIRTVLKAGAKAYMVKSVNPIALFSAIDSILNDHFYYTIDMAPPDASSHAEERSHNSLDQKPQITKREQEILQMIKNEYTNQRIADELFVSPSTVDTHRRNLLRKCNARNTAGLLLRAVKWGYIDPGTSH